MFRTFTKFHVELVFMNKSNIYSNKNINAINLMCKCKIYIFIVKTKKVILNK